MIIPATSKISEMYKSNRRLIFLENKNDAKQLMNVPILWLLNKIPSIKPIFSELVYNIILIRSKGPLNKYRT